MDDSHKQTTKLTKILILMIVVIGTIGVLLSILSSKINRKMDNLGLIEKNFDQSQSDFGKVSYYGGEIKLPENLPQVKILQNLSPNPAEELAKKLNISPVEGEQDFWISEEWNMVYDENDRLILLSSIGPSNTSMTLDKATSILKAKQWLEKLDLGSNMEVNQNSIAFFVGEYQLKPSSESAAGFVQMQFGPTINDFPLYIGQNQQQPILMMLDSAYNLLKVVIYPQQIVEIAPTTELPTLTIDQAVENISQKNMASIIGYDGIPSEYDLTQVKRLDLTSGSVEYRLQGDGQIALPYYRFEGKATLADQKVVEVDVISPAIKI